MAIGRKVRVARGNRGRSPHKQEIIAMLTIEQYAAPSTYDPPSFAQAVKVTGAQSILFISGQVAWTGQGGAAYPADFKAQAHAVLAALKAQVEAGGGTMANLVKVTTYLTDARYQAEFRDIRKEYFGEKMPAATAMVVQALWHPDCLVEVEGIAVL
jgi:2-iminobutanoate/2-iminopropanoate deaminase